MYLIVGAKGFLGSYLIKNILSMTNDEVVAADVNYVETEKHPRLTWKSCDITDEKDVMALKEYVKDKQNLKVIYLPVFFNVNKNPENDKIAWNVNVLSFARFLDVFDDVSVFYGVSTDMLYKEDRDIPYTEHDEITPMNDYARHKAIEERMLEAKGYNVVRLPVMMGPSLSAVKKHFYDDIVSNLQAGKSMEFFTDSWRSMIDFDTVSQTLVRLIETPAAHQYPIVNIAGDEALSKYDFALRLAEKYSLDKNLVIPISMDNDTKIWTEKRPKKILLDNKLVKQILQLNELKIKI